MNKALDANNEELIGMNDELVREIKERKRIEKEKDSLSEQLLHSKKIESVGIMAGGIAHDFNTILAGIIGYSDLAIAEIPDDHPAREFINYIIESGERAVKLIQQLLAFSRKQFLQPKSLNLNDELKKVDRELTQILGGDLKTIYELEEHIWNIEVDPVQLKEITINLTENARDAMQSGGTLTIKTANSKLDNTIINDQADFKDGDFVMLSFTDNGIGMDEEMLSKIFDPFFTTKGLGERSGLGLSTIHGVVSQSGGYIFAKSNVGEGTTISIYFPRAKDTV